MGGGFVGCAIGGILWSEAIFCVEFIVCADEFVLFLRRSFFLREAENDKDHNDVEDESHKKEDPFQAHKL